jgi:hypothetical protein
MMIHAIVNLSTAACGTTAGGVDQICGSVIEYSQFSCNLSSSPPSCYCPDGTVSTAASTTTTDSSGKAYYTTNCVCSNKDALSFDGSCYRKCYYAFAAALQLKLYAVPYSRPHALAARIALVNSGAQAVFTPCMHACTCVNSDLRHRRKRR